MTLLDRPAPGTGALAANEPSSGSKVVAARDATAATDAATERRWRLSRAGIVNVYQYDREEIEFRGGRLLLRGVNGAGKSTAMNMLLPFLLTASERNIAAASGQTKVLKGWMLDTRIPAQAQPVGYVWIEFARAGQHLSLGCGIRANRGGKSVDTWWFVTPERLAASDADAVPGTVPVTVGDTPLTRDQLRQALSGPDSRVFTHNQRSDYRLEVRRRLFGGADISEHLELLNKLRDPRIGDAIDNKLAEFLTRAMPSLSEEAVSAAAAPLQKLEDHRQVLAQLERTHNAVEALLERYRVYCTGDLRQRRDVAASAFQVWRSRARSHDSARADMNNTAQLIEAAKSQAVELQRQMDACAARIQTLKDTDAYRSSASISELRESVAADASRLSEIETELQGREQRLAETAATLDEREIQAAEAVQMLQCSLDAAIKATNAQGLRVGATEVELASSAVDGTAARCFDSLNDEDVKSWMRRASDAASNRLNALRPLSATLETHAKLRHHCDDAALAESGARLSVETADVDAAAARAELDARKRAWVSEAHHWAKAMLEQSSHRMDLASLRRWSGATDRTEVLDYAAEHGALRRDADRFVEDMVDARSAQQRDLHELRSARSDAENALGELMDRTEPDPPRQPWQRGGQWHLADVIDFNANVGAEQRAGLEAALEASGLLSARPERGGLRLVAGELVATCSSAVEAPLSEYLHAKIPARLETQVEPQLIEDSLASISTRPEPGAPAAVGVDGTFVVGTLAGRHTKSHARLIGAAARRAKLEEDRRQARALLVLATEAVETAEAALDQRESAVQLARRLRDQVPEVTAIHGAAGAVATAESALAQARQRLDRCRQDSATALDEVRASWADLATAAASLGVPADAESFAATRAELQPVPRQAVGVDAQPVESDPDPGPSWLERCDAAAAGLVHDLAAARDGLGQLIDSLLRQCSHSLDKLTLTVSGWESAGRHFTVAQDDARRQASQRDRYQDLLSQKQRRLTQLEESIGADTEQVLREIDAAQQQLGTHKNDREAAQQRHEELQALLRDQTGSVARADADAAAAHRDCEQAIARLVAALRCAGYVSAAVEHDSHQSVLDAAETASEAVDNLRGLLDVLDDWLSESDTNDAADADWNTVRRSLDHHKAAMGVWDAHYDPPDATLPLRISLVSGGEPVPLVVAARQISSHHDDTRALLAAEEQNALRALLEGLIASELADKMHRCNEMVQHMNEILGPIRTSQQIGASLRWQPKKDLDDATAQMMDLLAKPPGMRSHEETTQLRSALSDQLQAAREENPDADYAELIAEVLDYKQWHDMTVFYHRGNERRKLHSRSPLSAGEMKVVTYLPLFAALASSYNDLDDSPHGPLGAPRFALLDDAFAKVSADNHADLFGLLVTLDLDFIATSERLQGLHATVPQLSIVEILRDSRTSAILLERSYWNGRTHETAS